ncbi:GIY-YIG nuclease family protein [Candidatus Shapirobacteria bacterium]|nr:GIY-YIG nuclease family protein [Candidatus Shapirobacteria bacterium]
MYYFTYVLQSKIDSSLYIGWTNNLKHRFLQHNSGKVFSTKLKIPYKIIYFECCLNEKDAIVREKSLKTGFGRKYIKNRLNSYFTDIIPHQI